ncbi:uncharacterized protein ARB_01225 [Trichophyton benhamiae CBS 112371]|uniref:Uncharacterized protein n=1 Tax=Arthroderma benhamiae (strain ATCC MYA-4681 / CBS 112371) TaxID=663331 RepID=D4AYF6_ARTBC|nr:uncharacterized protein ARB_01225 [Trichophyton benhamiae CBS 112371]EFE31972.1 hypothetical protein ARB_01225 [Trichophyton benhamiae CBS 112371]
MMGSRLEAGGEAEQRKNQEKMAGEEEASKHASKRYRTLFIGWKSAAGSNSQQRQTQKDAEDAEDAAGRATKREAVGYSQLVTHPVTTPYSRQLQYEGQQQQQQATANNKKTELRPPKLPLVFVPWNLKDSRVAIPAAPVAVPQPLRQPLRAAEYRYRHESHWRSSRPGSFPGDVLEEEEKRQRSERGRPWFLVSCRSVLRSLGLVSTSSRPLRLHLSTYLASDPPSSASAASCVSSSSLPSCLLAAKQIT